MRRSPPLFRWFCRLGWLGITLLLLICLQPLAPVWAQSNSTAAIELDGYVLFQVWSSDQFSATERAENANEILQQVVEVEQPVQVEVVERNQLPVLEVNNRYLLTVTRRDTIADATPQEQAELWKRQLQRALERGQGQRQPGYVQGALILTLVILLLAIAAHWGLGWIWRHWLRRLLPPQTVDPTTGQEPQSMRILLQSLLAIARLGLWLLVVTYISDLFPLARIWSRRIMNAINNSLIAPLFSLGERAYSVVDLIILICLFLGLLLLARSGKTLLRTRVLGMTGMNRGAQEAIAYVTTYVFLFIGTIVLLQLWGLDLSSLAILASVLGVGIGLGLQGIAKEFFSGLVLIFEQPIQIGDFIEVGNLQGTVERINVRSTEIRTLDHVSIIIPNSRFLESEVINWSHHSPISRLRLPIGVAYGSNLSQVGTALIEVAKEHPDILREPAPQVMFREFADSSLNFDLLVWIADPRKQYLIKSDLYFRIDAILRDRQIEIPFPQQDLHLRSGHLPLEFPPGLTESLTQLSTHLALWLNSHTNGRNQGPARPAGDLPETPDLEPPNRD